VGTRKDIIQKFNGEIVKALTSPELKSRLSKDSADVMASTPDEFRDYIASETVKWA
jgi:tripartite-type tricarboxylate transporter receptor subunit TctC